MGFVADQYGNWKTMKYTIKCLILSGILATLSSKYKRYEIAFSNSLKSLQILSHSKSYLIEFGTYSYETSITNGY